MKKINLYFLPLLIVLFFAACGSQEEQAQAVTNDNSSFEELKKEGNKEYTLKTTTGETIKFKVENDVLKTDNKLLKDKVVLINFWATWCPPCKKEIPTFNRVLEEYSNDFIILGVLYEKDKDMKELKAFMDEFNMKFPVTVGDENFRMAKAFDDVKRVPESFVYGKDGKFIEQFIGEVDEESLITHIKNNL